MKTICVIPARAGSKGIPSKNLKRFCGIPLVEHTIALALDAEVFSHVVVSSDCAETRERAGASGAVAHWRPDAYSTDTAPTELAVLDALRLPIALDCERVAIMQPTSPLLTAADVRHCVSNYNGSVVSACVRHGFTWRDEYARASPVGWHPQQRPMRQRRSEYTENGAIYVTDVDKLHTHMCRTSDPVSLYVMPMWQSMQLDGPDDWAAIEALHRWQCGEV